MNGIRKVTTGVMLAATLTTSAFMTGTAHASSEGRRNTAIAIGAVAVHQLLKGKTTNAVVAGAGAAYAYKRYQDKRSQERDRNNYRNRRSDRYDDYDRYGSYSRNDRDEYSRRYSRSRSRR